MKINRENIRIPAVVRAAVCWNDPSDHEWELQLSRSLFGEDEIARELGVVEPHLRTLLNDHRRCVPINNVVTGEHMDSTSRRKWNSYEEMWREKKSDIGPFVGGMIFTVECQILLYWDIRVHNGRRSYPFPICFNPDLLKLQWQRYQDQVVPRIRLNVSGKDWSRKEALIDFGPDNDLQSRLACRQMYSVDELKSDSTRTLLVTQSVFSLTDRYARIQMVTWNRADLVCDFSDFLDLRREEIAREERGEATSKTRWH